MKSEVAKRPGQGLALEQSSTPKMKLVEGFLYRGETRSDLCFEGNHSGSIGLEQEQMGVPVGGYNSLVGCDGIGRRTGEGEKVS